MLLANSGMLVLEFYSPHCSICAQAEPVLEAMAAEKKGEVTFARISTDESVEIAVKLGVVATPTFLFFCGSRAVGAWVGYISEAALRDAIESMSRYRGDCGRNTDSNGKENEHDPHRANG